MKKIVVLDQTAGGVHIFDFDPAVFNGKDMSVFFDEVQMAFRLGLHIESCTWMVVDELKIEIH